MRPSQISQQSVALLALTTPVLSCVTFSLNHQIAGSKLGNCSNNYNTYAGLSDNGSQVCSLTNRIGGVCGDITLSCISGYSARISVSGLVTYSYPGFSGTFQTTITKHGDYNYHEASVWGC